MPTIRIDTEQNRKKIYVGPRLETSRSVTNLIIFFFFLVEGGGAKFFITVLKNFLKYFFFYILLLLNCTSLFF